MKKRCMAWLLLMLLLAGTCAQAEEVAVLPDPGAFFGFVEWGEYYRGVRVSGDYSKQMYQKYITLMLEEYGLVIEDGDDRGFEAFCWVKDPDSDAFRYLVMWNDQGMMLFMIEGKALMEPYIAPEEDEAAEAAETEEQTDEAGEGNEEDAGEEKEPA